MYPAVRLTKTKYLKTAFSGDGARAAGGRWNSPGTRLVYTASSLSLATLELMVHLEDYGILQNLYSFVRVQVPENCVEVLPELWLRTGWDSLVPGFDSQQMGDQWIREGRSAVLRVPSVISSGEYNYLINPNHDDFKKITMDKPERFKCDPRLV